METTLDGILNKRVALEQPAHGFRVAVDTVLLAAAVPVVAGDTILDMGCGVGGAMLAVACRNEDVRGMGIEIQTELTTICQRNIARNVFAGGLRVRVGDVAALPPEMAGAFDHVLMNPPFHDEARHDVSDDAHRRTANADKDGDLGAWVASAGAALKTSGSLTLIHRADRLKEICFHLRCCFGEIEILPLSPKTGGEAKRIIIRARKDAPQFVQHCQPLGLHNAEGGFTDEAENILRHCGAVEFRQAK